MNCQGVISKLGFRCRDLGADTLRVWSPFSYGNDGERIGLYVEKQRNGYRVTDNCEALMHASSMGVSLSENKVNAVRRATGFGVSISDGGEITAFVSEDDLGQGLASVLNASLAVSHLEGQWSPRARASSFANRVAGVLENSLGEKLLRNVTVTGASGHQLEFLLAVQSRAGLTYVQPIAATEDNTVDWKNVYAGWGRLTDLKKAKIAGTSRVAVIEEAVNDAEMDNATAILADTASVVNFSKLREWAHRIAA
ncbi:MAG: DUF1828 domain-containing protein [Ramlibacter sp.]|nr:DUF1828 domain-containing protein [Ramlibacter sp.]